MRMVPANSWHVSAAKDGKYTIFYSNGEIDHDHGLRDIEYSLQLAPLVLTIDEG